MGIQRLQGYLSKYFFEAFHEITESEEESHEKHLDHLPQQAIYLIDVSNLLSQKLNVQGAGTSCLWEKLSPLLHTIATRGLSTQFQKVKDHDNTETALADLGHQNSKIVLFYDVKGNGKSECRSFQLRIWNKWKETVHNCWNSKGSSEEILNSVLERDFFNVLVCQNSGDSADRMIFLMHQTMDNTGLPVLIVSNDSDMLLYAMQNMHGGQSKLTNLCVLPSAYSLFTQRASSHRPADRMLFQYYHIQLHQLEQRISKIFMPSFVFQILILLGNSGSVRSISRGKRDRRKKGSSLGFDGILTYHKNDITIYRTLYSSWNFLLKEMQGRKASSSSKELLVWQTDTAVTINLLMLKRMLVDIGPSVFQGSDCLKNAENYLRVVALNLHYYTTACRGTVCKEDTVEIPSLVAICSMLKNTSDFSISTATCSSQPRENIGWMGVIDDKQIVPFH